MKKIFIVILLLFTKSIAFGQMGGTHAATVAAGYEKNGIYANFSYAYYDKEARFTRLGLNMHLENVDFEKEDVPIQLYIGYLEHYRKVFDIDFYGNAQFFMGLGLTGGYEQVNDGSKYLEDGRQIDAKTQWVYGLTGGIEIDQYLAMYGKHTNKLILIYLNARYNYYINSDVGHIQPAVSLGVKFTF